MCCRGVLRGGFGIGSGCLREWWGGEWRGGGYGFFLFFIFCGRGRHAICDDFVDESEGEGFFWRHEVVTFECIFDGFNFLACMLDVDGVEIFAHS